jgi:PLP dependent protein
MTKEVEPMLADNLTQVRNRIAEALQHRTGPMETGTAVTLVAVTKNHPPEVIPAIQALGVSNIGENRVQEAKAKQELLGHTGTWHLIGHLQGNKVKKAVALFDLIESVDSLELLESLDKEAGKAGKKQDILLQINVAREPQKTGFAPEDYEAAVPQLDQFANLSVRGIMVIAPATDDEALIRRVFHGGYHYFCTLKAQRPGIDCLSMGMTSDYPLAIEEGANMIRVGTALFGPRDYNLRNY